MKAKLREIQQLLQQQNECVDYGLGLEQNETMIKLINEILPPQPKQSTARHPEQAEQSMKTFTKEQVELFNNYNWDIEHGDKPISECDYTPEQTKFLMDNYDDIGNYADHMNEQEQSYKEKRNW